MTKKSNQKMAKRKNNVSGMQLFLLILFALFIVVGLIFLVNYAMQFSAVDVGKDNNENSGNMVTVGDVSCPDTGYTDLKVELQNLLNETGSETFDATVYVLTEDGSVYDTITDTTAPSATDIECGKIYQLAVVAANADGGDNTVIKSIISGADSDNQATIVDGNVRFVASGAQDSFKFDVEQHGVLEFRLFDNLNNRYAYDTSDTTNTGYEGDGVTFTDGDNSTAFAVGSGGELDFTLNVRTVDDDEDFEDRYVIVAFEAPVTTWEAPSVSINGVSASEYTGLNDEERLALTDYEYFYKIDSDMLNGDVIKIDVQYEALSGQNPTSDLEIDFYSAGQYLKNDGSGVAVGTHKDDSSRTVLFTVQDVTVDIS